MEMTLDSDAVTNARRALLVDDDIEVAAGLEALLELEGWETATARAAPEAYRALSRFQPDLVLLDLNLAGHSGLDILDQIKAFDESIAVVMISGYGTIETAVEALKRGATSFLQKPFDAAQLKLVLTQVDEAIAAQKKLASFRRSGSTLAIVGVSEAARRINETVAAIADASSSVLIEGESGTGKRVVARALHEQSPRSAAAFVELNCSGMSGEALEAEIFGYERGVFRSAASSKAGLLELAAGGTVFLRQISELPLPLQARLVTAMDEKCFRRVGGVRAIGSDFRLLAATRSDLAAEVEGGRFREDLFYRLNVVTIHMPPLRDRTEDVPLLVAALLDELGRDLGVTNARVSPAALDALTTYHWPGNVRELRNTLERALLLSRGAPITRAQIDLGTTRRSRPTAAAPQVIRPLDEVTNEYVRHAVELTGGNLREAARKLGISPSTLYSRLKQPKGGDGQKA